MGEKARLRAQLPTQDAPEIEPAGPHDGSELDDETFRQIVEALPVGGVFGIVMPQGILHSTQGKDLRRKLLDEYEISEITLFADKVFNYFYFVTETQYREDA